MNRRFQRMVDQVLNYKPPPQEKKAKERIAAGKKKRGEKLATKKIKSHSHGGE
jgi:hypothetical protein